MKLDLTSEAAEFGEVARKAIGAAGGDDLAHAAERDPAARQASLETLLGGLGAWDLDPRAGGDDLEAAAALCRSAGWWALPYPVAERLARPTDPAADALVVVPSAGPAAPVLGLDLQLIAVDLGGHRSRAVPSGPADPRKTAFVVPLQLHPLDDAGEADLALALALPCWVLLGMLDRALDLTRAHILAREQFGQPLASFQGVQFQLTDAEVERAGLAELAHHVLWCLQQRSKAAADDALALRLAAVEAADLVFRLCHQLHGAIGFCDETPLSWVSRASVPIRRLPGGAAATAHALAARLGRRPLAGMFNEGARW